MTLDDQAATLRRLAKSQSSGSVTTIDPQRRRVFAITGGKGGVGKSMIAVNLAALYARRGARALALDGDLGMADLNLLLGLAPTKSLLDVLQGTPIEEILLEAHGVHLLPALNGSFQLANIDASAREVLFTAVDSLSERFNTLVIDTGAGIGENTMAFASAAADVIIVATPEPLSIADAYACLKVLATRHGLTHAFLLPNTVRSPSEGEEMIARLKAIVDRFLGIAITPLPSIPFDPTVRVAAAAGVPLVMHNPDAPASRAIKKIAQRIDALSQSEQGSGEAQRQWLRRMFDFAAQKQTP